MTLLIRQQLVPLEVSNTPVSVGCEAASHLRKLQRCPRGSYDFLKHFEPGWREKYISYT
jgi:hypothetical protein